MPESIFSEEWRECLRAHYTYVVRNHDQVTERTLRGVMLEAGFSEADVRQLYLLASAHVDDVGADFVPDLEFVAEPETVEPEMPLTPGVSLDSNLIDAESSLADAADLIDAEADSAIESEPNDDDPPDDSPPDPEPDSTQLSSLLKRGCRMRRFNTSFRLIVVSLVVILAISLLPAQAQGAVFPCGDLSRQTDGDLIVNGGEVSANGVSGDLFCRVIVRDSGVNTSLSEIGVQSVIDQPIVQAVNLFGMVDGAPVAPFADPTYVCLRGQGSLIYLGALDTTHSPIDWGADPSSPAGYTCAYFEVSGTVVLVGSLNVVPTAVPNPDIQDYLYNCQITTRATLHYRSYPSMLSIVLFSLPAGTTWPATAHFGDWYQVPYEDLRGWVSDRYVTTSGDCD